MHGMIGVLHVKGGAVGIRVHGDGLHSKFSAGTNHANGDFTSVSDQKAFEHMKTLAVSYQLSAFQGIGLFWLIADR
jgi:hypothetical protein